jgi:hypothetical protein
MKKILKSKFFWGVILLTLILVLLAKFLPEKEKPTPTPAPVPTETPALSRPTGEKMSLGGVEIKNIYQDEIKTDSRGDTLFAQSKDYQIYYFAKENQFLISVLSSPFTAKREIAEKKFLELTGADETKACQLNVVVSTPTFVNQKEAGQNYGLSFCK